MNVWELFNLKNKVAFVTGGAKNLGRYIAEALAEAGADVVITSRVLENAQKTTSLIGESTGRTILPLELDVTNEDSVRTAVEKAMDRFKKIDIFVNNAGNAKTTALLEERKREDWEETFATNSTGVFLCTKYVIPHMMKQKNGSIIIIASVSGIAGKDRRHYLGSNMVGVPVDYSAAKGAVIAMMRDMAAYLAPYGIRVNSISPGGFERGQPQEFIRRYCEATMLGRMGQDDKDLKGAVVYLASESSSYVTGHNLVVDGGLTAW